MVSVYFHVSVACSYRIRFPRWSNGIYHWPLRWRWRHGPMVYVTGLSGGGGVMVQWYMSLASQVEMASSPMWPLRWSVIVQMVYITGLSGGGGVMVQKKRPARWRHLFSNGICHWPLWRWGQVQWYRITDLSVKWPPWSYGLCHWPLRWRRPYMVQWYMSLFASQVWGGLYMSWPPGGGSNHGPMVYHWPLGCRRPPWSNGIYHWPLGWKGWVTAFTVYMNTYSEVYVCYLQMVSGFPWLLSFPLPIKMTSTIWPKMLKVALNPNRLSIRCWKWC